jgi:hypothetical protein
MRNLTVVTGLTGLLKKGGVKQNAGEGFEELYDRLSSGDRHQALRQAVERRIRDYFADLVLPDRVTLYDQILGTLRPKDLIATFNWDPFLLQAYARNRDLQQLPRIVFLHGNVYLGHCPDHRAKGYSTQRCPTCKEPFRPSPLLCPIREKAYRNHSLLAGEWEELEARLEHAYMLTIFGYSAPTSDAAAREILLKAWNTNSTRELAQIEVVDVLPKRVLATRWQDFIVRQHYGTAKRIGATWQFMFPRRSCEALAWATLQQEPWAMRRLPAFRRLDRLKGWLQPLIDEEVALEKSGTPLTPFGDTA